VNAVVDLFRVMPALVAAHPWIAVPVALAAAVGVAVAVVRSRAAQ